MIDFSSNTTSEILKDTLTHLSYMTYLFINKQSNDSICNYQPKKKKKNSCV